MILSLLLLIFCLIIAIHILKVFEIRYFTIIWNKFRPHINNKTRTLQLEGEAVQILSYDESKKCYELNPKFETILFNNEIKDLPIAVISIAGPFRMGKSFMLNLFLRYLHSMSIKKDVSKWIENDDIPFNVFESIGQTMGIWIWSKIFKVNISGDKNIGIMLMDTQGTLDKGGVFNFSMFSLSMLLSSVQIFNVMQNIKEDDLQYLQLFAEFGQIAMEKKIRKPFQKLLFLIRDWEHIDDYPFGFKGGSSFVKEKLEMNINEQNCARTYIRSCYEKVDGYLMPHPGKKLTRHKTIQGNLKDILDDDFSESIIEFIPHILDAHNLLEKKINGITIKASDLLNYFISYGKILNNSKAIPKQNLTQVVVEANISSAVYKIIDYYNVEMVKYLGINVAKKKQEFILKLHEKASSDAIEMFQEYAVMGNEKQKSDGISRVSKMLPMQLTYYLVKNQSLETSDLKETMRIIIKELKILKQNNKVLEMLINELLNQFNDIKESENCMLFYAKVIGTVIVTGAVCYFAWQYIIPYLLENLPNVTTRVWNMLHSKDNINVSTGLQLIAMLSNKKLC